ncbi:transposase [Legionella pneumophila]|uniref:transposase n=1 Tax=Legionella pneumophila TaxID=446 RepID=UPI0038B5159F
MSKSIEPHQKATIERWYHRRYQIEGNELLNTPCPKVLGLDEHFFSRKHGFATTLCDLKKHKVFDIVKGRSDVVKQICTPQLSHFFH